MMTAYFSREFFSFLPLFLFCITSSCTAADAQFKTEIVDPQTLLVTITLIKPENAYIYSEHVSVSVDNPSVKLSDWKTDQQIQSIYDPKFKTTKKVFKDTVIITCTAQVTQPLTQPAYLHVTYYTTKDTHITKKVYALPFTVQASVVKEEQETPVASADSVTLGTNSMDMPQKKIAKHEPSYTQRISALIEHTDSVWLRLILVMILGIFMSLTPCIYPMIPITVGILQAQGSKSLLRNVALSLCYTTGIATTFALLGLLAATTGQMLGTFMANPLVILIIVCVLAYLGGAMFGWYDMYLPSFAQPGSMTQQNGSYTSAFLFGIASGTVASPCLSPGLILLLTIVTTLKSKFMGFMLLFMFGVGLSLPLLLVGTFSSSLSLLPRAGMWMVEIKKCFGFVLFGMCFYFLRPLVPMPLLLTMVALFLCITGITYLYSDMKKNKSIWKTVSGIIGISCIAASIMMAAQAYKAYLIYTECDVCDFWSTDYAKTLETAQHCSGKIFIDVGASFCSMCTAIDAKVLSHPDVVQALQHFCCVKINGSNDPENVVKQLQENYTLHGFPTFLLIDAKTGKLIKRWGSELYEVSCPDFARELEELAAL